MRTLLLTFVLLLVSAFSTPTTLQQSDEQTILRYFHSISSEEITDWMTEICSPKYNGRLAGTPEYLEVAGWAAQKMKEWGIKPAGDNGSYFQRFDHPYTVVNDIGALRLHIQQKDGSVIMKSYTAPVGY